MSSTNGNGNASAAGNAANGRDNFEIFYPRNSSVQLSAVEARLAILETKSLLADEDPFTSEQTIDMRLGRLEARLAEMNQKQAAEAKAAVATSARLSEGFWTHERKRVYDYLNGDGKVLLGRLITPPEVDTLFDQGMGGRNTYFYLRSPAIWARKFSQVIELAWAIRDEHRIDEHERMRVFEIMQPHSLTLTRQQVDELFEGSAAGPRLIRSYVDLLQRTGDLPELARGSIEKQIERLKAVYVRHQEQLEAILTFLRKPDTLGGGLLRPPLDARLTRWDAFKLVTESRAGLCALSYLHSFAADRMYFTSVDDLINCVRTTHVDNLNQILVFMRSNRFTLLHTSWEERVMVLSLDWVHKLVNQGRGGALTLDLLEALVREGRVFKTGRDIITLVRQQAEARQDAVRVASFLRDPSRRLLPKSISVTRRDIFQLLQCHAGKYSVDLLAALERRQDGVPYESFRELLTAFSEGLVNCSDEHKFDVAQYLESKECNLLRGDGEAKITVNRRDIERYWMRPFTTDDLRSFNDRMETFKSIEELVNRLKSRYRMVDLIPIKSDPSITDNDDKDTNLHITDMSFDDQEEAKRNLQKYVKFELQVEGLGEQIIGTTDPYIEIYRKHGHIWEKVGQSEVAVDRRAAGFRAQVISLKDLCLDDLHRKILVKCMDNNVHSSWGASVTIGQFSTTVYDILHDINKLYPLVDPNERRKKQPGFWYTNSGHARFTSSSLLLAVTRSLYTPRIRFIFPDPVELTVKIDITALGLPKVAQTGTIAFLEVFSRDGSGWKRVYTSEQQPHHAKKGAEFIPIVLRSSLICDNQWEKPIRFQCWHRNHKAENYLGSAEISFQEMIVGDIKRNAQNDSRLQVMIAGPPASGKGTQCLYISRELGLVHINTGDLLRNEARSGSDIGKKVDVYMKAGELVPDDIMIELVRKKLDEKESQEKGWLLHGYPRTKTQADALQRAGIIADVFLLLDVPDALLVDRIVGRRVDPVTNEIYHMRTRPPPSKEIERRCMLRSDDTEDAIKVRIAKYHQHVAEVRKFFGKKMVTVNGNQSPEAVFLAIKQVLPLNGVRRTRSPMTYAPKVFKMRRDVNAMIVKEHVKGHGTASRKPASSVTSSPSSTNHSSSSPPTTATGGTGTGTTGSVPPPSQLTATLSGPPPLAPSSSQSHLLHYNIGGGGDDERNEERIPDSKLDWSNVTSLLAFNSVLLLAPAKEITRYAEASIQPGSGSPLAGIKYVGAAIEAAYLDNLFHGAMPIASSASYDSLHDKKAPLSPVAEEKSPSGSSSPKESKDSKVDGDGAERAALLLEQAKQQRNREALVNREKARHERDITTLHTKVLAYKREATEKSLKEKIWFQIRGEFPRPLSGPTFLEMYRFRSDAWNKVVISEVQTGSMPTWGPITLKPSVLLTDARAVDINSPVLIRAWTLKGKDNVGTLVGECKTTVGELRAQWLTPNHNDGYDDSDHDDELHVRAGRRPLPLVHPDIMLEQPSTYDNSGLLSFVLLPPPDVITVNPTKSPMLPVPSKV